MMKITCGGGSSRIFSKALKAEVDSMCTSSMIKILLRSREGAYRALSRNSRTLSTPVFDAASISSTSIDWPAAISLHDAHWLHGSIVGPWTQFKPCLLYTSDAADERSSVDLGGRRI